MTEISRFVRDCATPYFPKRKTIELRYHGPGKIEVYFQSERLEIRRVDASKRPNTATPEENYLVDLDRWIRGAPNEFEN